MKSMEMQSRLTRYIQRELEEWDFSGVIRIVSKGEILWQTCRGEACIEHDMPNTMSTLFAAASVTKQFTAFAIMLLYDQGMLELDAEANTYLPDDLQLPSDISVHHLLSHTSGLYNYYCFEDDFYIGADRLPYDQKRFFHEWIIKQPIREPGTVFEYNNSNYHLLAWIIEHVSQRTYADYLNEHVFLPLGMKHTAFDDGFTIMKEKAENYMHNDGKVVRTPYYNPLFCTGSGTLVTNCDDMQKWYECLKERKLLSSGAYERFLAENLNHYCYGLERHIQNGALKYVHGGDMNGVSAYVQYFFEDDICILILSNNESLDQYRLGNAIADLLYDKEPAPSLRPQEFPVSQQELEKYSGVYLPGKIEMEVKDGKLYLVRVNQNIHIELYCIAPGVFLRRNEEQGRPYILWPKGAERPSIWGFPLVQKRSS